MGSKGPSGSLKNTGRVIRANAFRSAVAILVALFASHAPAVHAQANTGELRLKVTDTSGLGVKALVRLQNEASQYDNTLETDDSGQLDAKRLPFGAYQVQIQQPGFAPYSQSIEVRSQLPTDFNISLRVASINTRVSVTVNNTLIDPDQAGSVNQIGSSTIENRLSSLPGRSIQDLVNSQPGWLYEGNAVLHPRGSEYQTQFVVDGIPLTDNRSPSFGPELEADDVDSISIYTAGIPAEYGRKMGGVVELNTLQDTTPGFHGEAILSGGSYDTAGAFFKGQYVWGKNAFGVSASGNGTAHYLNPVVTQNYTNRGTVGDFSANYERDFTPNDRFTMSVRHEFSRYELPNEDVQESAGQLQTADNFETMGIISYQHTFSPQVVADFSGMVRDNANDFYSNPDSTPILITQHNWFREGYFKGTATIDHGRHEIKAGVESDNIFLNEKFHYAIPNVDTQLAYFDPSTPLTFSFMANRPDLEQAAFVQDLVRIGDWTINAGIRWDHYQLILNRQAVQPRLAISRYFPDAGIVVHFSYDRVFQTPSFENILLSSSTAAAGLDTISVQLPVQPSEGNYYEAGLAKGFSNKFRIETNYFRRAVNNYADDDQIENTTISYPIAFEKAIIYGGEAKLTLVDWKRFSGFASYSYEVGNAWFPVTGGLFLGDDAVLPTSGHLPDSQDQRNTVRGRISYQLTPRLWIAGGVQYDTGLPFDFQCPSAAGNQTPEQTLQQCIASQAQIYGSDVVNRLNFDRDRILPSFQVSASAGIDVYKSERVNVHFQADGENLTNVVEVIDFGGLFSGNAIGPARSFSLRLRTDF
ncbi:MAG: TonB-dependent receptor [Candidatus Acidiferrales bacterium]